MPYTEFNLISLQVNQAFRFSISLERLIKNAEDLNRSSGKRLIFQSWTVRMKIRVIINQTQLLFHKHHTKYFGREKNNMRRVSVLIKKNICKQTTASHI